MSQEEREISLGMNQENQSQESVGKSIPGQLKRIGHWVSSSVRKCQPNGTSSSDNLKGKPVSFSQIEIESE